MPTVVQEPMATSARPRVWRITDRHTFQELRRRGHRVRRGPLTVTWLAPAQGIEATPPRVAFAIGKAAGGAVVRNRVRRRLRAALHQLVVEDQLPAGSYLLGAGAPLTQMPWSELVELVRATVAEAQR